jgi:hypothetical protein
MNNELVKVRIVRVIGEWVNPYPPDLFCWQNDDVKNLTTGRFNQFVWQVVENTRADMIRLIEEEFEDE